MLNTTDPAVIFLPMLVVVALTFLAFFNMLAKRIAANKAGMSVDYYRAYIDGHEPEATNVAVRHYANLFEMPVVFYAGCLTAFVLDAVTWWVLVLAWVFVAGRLAQSAVHLTYNNPTHRVVGFQISVLGLLALWVLLAMDLFARV